MKKRTLFLAIVLILAGGGVLAGLNSTIAGAEGKPATAAKSSNTQTHVEHFKDWDVRCAGAQGSETHCEMVQTLSQKKTNRLVMRVTVGYPAKGTKPVAIFLLPLGMNLPQGVQFSVDDGKAIGFPVQSCVTQGCRAGLLLKASLIKQLRTGSQATVVIHEPQGRAIKLPLSLTGFSDAFKRISS